MVAGLAVATRRLTARCTALDRAPGSTMATITLRNAVGDDIAHQRLPVIVVAP